MIPSFIVYSDNHIAYRSSGVGNPRVLTWWQIPVGAYRIGADGWLTARYGLPIVAHLVFVRRPQPAIWGFLELAGIYVAI